MRGPHPRDECIEPSFHVVEKYVCECAYIQSRISESVRAHDPESLHIIQ